MYKNVIIALLFLGVLIFSAIAIRNSRPISCDHLIRTSKDKIICAIDLGDIQEDDVTEALHDLYEKQPLF